ncbi:MAG: glycosyltransferase family 4 protein [Chloroflexi bacterium]|nr:glycosyltransferase family 4 protein [Chloroflexota bacterium]
MNVSIVCQALIGSDAVGHSIINQARYFTRRGDAVAVYAISRPARVPADVLPLARTVSLADLAARPDNHFSQSDVYIYHYTGRFPLIETIRALERGVVILFFHNVTPPTLWDGEWSDQEALQHSIDSIPLVANYADLIVTPSPYNADYLVRTHGLGRDKIRVLPLAVPLDEFGPGEKDAVLLNRYGLSGKKILLFAGRMARNKRVDLLVDALAQVRAQFPAALLLVGDGDSTPTYRASTARIRARAAELQLSRDVLCAGVVDDLPTHFRLADIYVSASLHEGFGVPLIEAMASGVPVVASNATAHSWVIGDAGMLCRPGDAADMAATIVRVLGDSDLRADLIRKGIARAREFSVARHDEGWSRLMAELSDWLPNPLAARASSAPTHAAEPAWYSSLSIELGRLDALSDVMMRGYVVQSHLPVVGQAIAWIRRTLTSHLREPYLDPMLERQVAFNRQLALVVRRLSAEVFALSRAPSALHVDRDAFASPKDSGEIANALARLQAQLDRMTAALPPETNPSAEPPSQTAAAPERSDRPSAASGR